MKKNIVSSILGFSSMPLIFGGAIGPTQTGSLLTTEAGNVPVMVKNSSTTVSSMNPAINPVQAIQEKLSLNYGRDLANLQGRTLSERWWTFSCDDGGRWACPPNYSKARCVEDSGKWKGQCGYIYRYIDVSGKERTGVEWHGASKSY